MKPGRLLVLLLFAAVLVLGWLRLAGQGAAWGEVALTGVLFAGGLVAFFGLLLGAGKLVGRIVKGGDD